MGGAFRPAFPVILTVAIPPMPSAYMGAADGAVSIARDRAAAGQASDPVAPVLLAELETAHATAEPVWQAMISAANALDVTPTASLAAAVLTRETIAARAVSPHLRKGAGGAGYPRRTGLEGLPRGSWGADFHPLPEKRRHLSCGRLAMGLDPVSGAPQGERLAAA